VPAAESDWRIRAGAAVLAGSAEGLLAPLERMQTVLQHRHYTDQFAHTWDVAAKLRVYGLREYYRGLSAILLRNGPANAIFFTLRDPVRELLPAHPWHPGHHDGGGGGVAAASGGEGAGRGVPGAAGGGAPPAWALRARLAAASDEASERRFILAWDFMRNFFSGAVLGATISTLFYPINVVKSMQQIAIGGPHRGVADTFVQLYHERNGWGGIYRGVNANILRSLLSWGIINSCYELTKRLFVRPVEADVLR
jgi:hypothetical protein